MPKVKLTATNIEKLPRPKPGQRVDYWDKVLPGFGVRVTAGKARFVFGSRFPGSKHFTRREIAPATAAGLVDARETARRWLQMVDAGIDPAREREQARLEEARKARHTLAAVAHEFISGWVIGDPKHPNQRQWKETQRLVNILVAAWGSRPIVDITRGEIVRLITLKKATAPAEARNIYGAARQLLSWARDQDFGLAHNVALDIRPAGIIGKKRTRKRALSTDELRQLWVAAGTLGWPVAQIYRLLILTGLRLGEVVNAAWSEIDLVKGVWTIPASRMKGKEGEGLAHVVPLTTHMVDIFTTLPHTSKEYVFSHGKKLVKEKLVEKPVVISTRAKDRLDAVLTLTEPWQNHDLRRSIKSGLAKMGIADLVSERVLAHVPAGIRKHYDMYDYLDERRKALEDWGKLIVPPDPAEGGGVVVPMPRRRRVALAG
jgi:integrase